MSFLTFLGFYLLSVLSYFLFANLIQLSISAYKYKKLYTAYLKDPKSVSEPSFTDISVEVVQTFFLLDTYRQDDQQFYIFLQSFIWPIMIILYLLAFITKTIISTAQAIASQVSKFIKKSVDKKHPEYKI